MKKTAFIFIAVFLCLGNIVFAQRHKVPTEKINVMTDVTSMQMDLVSFGNIAYEAILSTDISDFSELTPIFINTYVDNVYDSTLCITLDEFINYEFDEYYSHYNFLKLYALGPDELILTVYYPTLRTASFSSESRMGKSFRQKATACKISMLMNSSTTLSTEKT